MTPELGYPAVLIVGVLTVGLPLAIVRPYFAFLFATLVLTAGNADLFNATRFMALGPYLNLGDVCLLVALAALMFDTFHRNKPLRLPNVVLLLLLVLSIAAWQSLWMLGWTYETARAFRWGVQFPLAFLLAANLVDTPLRAKQFLGALLAGVILAALQHLLFVSVVGSVRAVVMQEFHLVRSIAFLAGGMPVAFVLTWTVWKMPVSVRKQALYLMVGTLLLVSILFTQTRSVWFAAVAAVPCLLVLFQKRTGVMITLRLGVLVFFVATATGLVSRFVAPKLDIYEVMIQRTVRTFQEDPREAQTSSRISQLTVEMDSWLQGTLILGRGLYFFQTVDRGEGPEKIAFGHLGYVTYLSQLGLLGLFIYGFYLPFSVVRDSRRMWRHGGLSVFRYLGLLGAASIIYLSLQFLMSSSFLGITYFAPGTLYGAVWVLARSTRRQAKLMQNSEDKKYSQVSNERPGLPSLRKHEVDA